MKIPSDEKQLRKLLKKASTADFPFLLREGRKLLADGNADWKEFEKKLILSTNRVQTRISRFPEIRYNESLPIAARKGEIVEAIKNNQVLVLSGETGSGKTTQIPKMCLESGLGKRGKIACTQPRRIAALSVSARIAEELNVSEGKQVGYKIRFQENDDPRSLIKIMTDGILLAELQSDPFLNEYEAIIIDEAHERSLNIDFIIGFLRTLIKKRRDLKVIITSATIDTQKFSESFNKAPIIEVSGRLYPVELRYRDDEEESDKTLAEQTILPLEDILTSSHSGDILIFMPTEQDINESCELINQRFPSFRLTILPLFARLPSSEQKKVFQKTTGRKIIVSTNVAETSLTIPGIKYVIDTGLARISRYSPSSGTQGLPILPIPRSSADQRKGRCGRVENGICYRLYSEADYNARQPFSIPEIQRTNLSEVLLKMLSLKIHDPESFPFIDPPTPAAIQDGYKTLIEVNAIEEKGKGKSKYYRLTKTGRVLSRFPLDPRLSRILIQADSEGCLKDVIPIISLLALHDPRRIPSDKAGTAKAKHAEFKQDQSDFLTFLNIWNKGKLENARTGDIKRFSREYFLSFKILREWSDIHRQLKSLLKENKYVIENRYSEQRKKKNEEFDSQYLAVHKALLSGFLFHVSLKKDEYNYRSTRNRESAIFPGSVLFKEKPEWILSAEQVRTSKLYLRINGVIRPEWVEEAGKHILKRTAVAPWWDPAGAAVLAHEEVRLFGFLLSKDKKAPLGKYDPAKATEMFIENALVNEPGSALIRPSFLGANRKKINELRKVEEKLRKKEYIISDAELYQFYLDRLGPVCFEQNHLLDYISDHGEGSLYLKEEDIIRTEPDWEELALFPDKVETEAGTLKIKYNFTPGGGKDGATVRIKEKQKEKLNPENLDSFVPGLIPEKIEALIKALPKAIRKKLIPVRETAAFLAGQCSDLADSELTLRLSEVIRKEYGVVVSPVDWNLDAVPEHLKLRIEILDDKGRVVKAGRDISLLNEKIAPEKIPEKIIRREKQKWEQAVRKEWIDLPEKIKISDGKIKGELYPACCPKEKGLGIRIFSEKDEAEKKHLLGCRQFMKESFSGIIKNLSSEFTFASISEKYLLYAGGQKKIADGIWQSAFHQLIQKAFRTQEEYLALKEEIAPRIYNEAESIYQSYLPLLTAWGEVHDYLLQLSRRENHFTRYIKTREKDVKRLVPDNFFESVPSPEWPDITRYLKGIKIRTEKGILNPSRDNEKEIPLVAVQSELESMINQRGGEFRSAAGREKLHQFRSLLKEWELSLFSPEIKTKGKISEKRIRKAMEELSREI